MEPILKPGERIDDLQRNSLRIIQNKDGFCFGMDAVLLTGFASAKPTDRLIDLGTGTGIIPILMFGKYGCRECVGVEIQENCADMANRSVMMNEIEDHVRIHKGDIKAVKEDFKAGEYDCVTSNPPYMISEHGIQNPNSPKAISRHEVLVDLDGVVQAAAYLLKDGGAFYMVHRPFRLPEIMSTLQKYRLEPKRMRLVYPHVDDEPNMVLIEARKYGKPRLTVMPPLILMNEDGTYTQEIKETYGF